MTRADRPDAPVRILPLSRDNLEAMLAIERASFDEPWSRAQLAREFDLDHSRRIGAFLTEGRRLAGYLIAWRLRGEVQVLNLAVDPGYRRRGIGRILLEDLLSRADAAQWGPVWLEVRPSNGPAWALYQSAGFELTGRRPGYYSDTGEDALVLVRKR